MAVDNNDESQYTAGLRAGVLQILGACIRMLPGGDPAIQPAILLLERQQAITTLRRICADFGDNDWPDTLNLSDIIEKHLERPLRRR